MSDKKRNARLTIKAAESADQTIGNVRIWLNKKVEKKEKGVKYMNEEFYRKRE